MSDRLPPRVEVGDIVRLRKPHACGNFTWRVVRTGVDVGLVCRQCGRRVLLPRSTFNKRLKAMLGREAEPPATGG